MHDNAVLVFTALDITPSRTAYVAIDNVLSVAIVAIDNVLSVAIVAIDNMLSVAIAHVIIFYY